MGRKNKTTHNRLWAIGKTYARLLSYYGASIDPHVGVQMQSAHRQAMCKAELDIPVTVQEGFAERQARCNLIQLWDGFDSLMTPT
jgi:hypothetical protein